MSDKKGKIYKYSDDFNYESYEVFSEKFAKNYYRIMNKIQASAGYNPIYANTLLKDLNTNPIRYTQAELKRFLNSPQDNESALRDFSQFLLNVAMQYKRSVYHFASLLSFKYELIPVNATTLTYYPTKEEHEKYDKDKEKHNHWLRKFKPKQQFPLIATQIIAEGGKFFYIRESDESIILQEMPQDYCWINGRTDYGYTYGLDMNFFLRYPDAKDGYAPEIVEWYKDFIKDRTLSKDTDHSIYRPMPPEMSVVFKFDDTTPAIIPPLTGTFKDALEIQDYKDLLKLKTELDTWCVISQEIPKDKDGNPTVDPVIAANFVALVQSTLPNGVKTFSTALKPEQMNFSQAQTMNSIVGMGEQNYWGSVGLAGNLFGASNNSGIALKYSLMTDYNFVKNLYIQFERFINFQLSSINCKYKFRVKFKQDLEGCTLFDEESKKMALSFAQGGGHKSALYSAFGYEPYEMKNAIIDDYVEDYVSKMTPLASSFTQSGKEGGAPNKTESDMTESGMLTRDNGYNDNK